MKAALRFHGNPLGLARWAGPERASAFRNLRGGVGRRGSGKRAGLESAMAGDWAGFSEQELRTLQGKRPGNPGRGEAVEPAVVQ